MSKSVLRVQSRRIFKSIDRSILMNSIMSELDESDLGRSAVVFSPHPDDETLGCGGTIIRKKRIGADITIVFVTDGRRSHRGLISGDEMKSIRAREALAASRMLGVEKNDVIFLEFENGKLDENRESAIFKVVDILVDKEPKEIFVPYYKEPVSWSEDHLATNRIVVNALQVYGRGVVIYEYPIGFWCHWPWVLRSSLKVGLLSGLRMVKDFRCSVYVGDVLGLKRAALDHYKSQMTRLIPDPRWWILGDVSNGEFLECFFQEREIFRQYSLNR